MLHYDHRGDGPLVTLLLHGFLGSGRNLSSLARRWVELDPRRTVIFPDLTGHGRSPALPHSPNLEVVARDVLALADRVVGDEPLPIVGHSMGGRVALKARILAPMRVSSLTLLDIGPGPIEGRAGSLEPVVEALIRAPERADSRSEMRASIAEAGIGRALTDWLLMNLVSTDDGGVTWRIDRDALVALQANTRDEPLWSGLDGPTLCIRGGLSPFVNETEVAVMHERGASVHTIENAGHFLHMDAQNELLQILVEEQTAR